MVDVEPDARMTLEPTGVGQTEFGEGIDDQTFDVAHVIGRTQPVADVDDRIADELSGTVVRDVATALDGDQFGADRGGLATQVRGEVGPSTVGEHVRVFQQQQVLAVAVFEQRRLNRQRLAIGHSTQPPDAQRGGGHADADRPERQSSVDQSLVSRISLTRARNRAA